MIGLLATLLVLVLGGAFLAAIKPGPVAGWLGAAATVSPTPPAETPEPTPSPVLAAAGAEARMPTAAGVRTAIDELVVAGGLGSRVNVSVIDVATHQSLYGRGGDAATLPASTTKLVTAATALASRGAAYRIPTTAVAGDEPGEVVLVGGGDPTLAIDGTATYPGAARLDKLAQQVKETLGATKPTKVTIDPYLFSGPAYGPGWDADIPNGGYGAAITALMTNGARINPKQRTGAASRQRNPDLAAGDAFAKRLGVSGKVTRDRAPNAVIIDPPSVGGGSAAAPTPGTGSAAAIGPGAVLGRVQSPPMGRLVEWMLAESDNVIAEALARQVALARNKPASYAGGAAAMDTVLTELGLSAAESGLADGSGLSRRNRLSPSLLTDLLALAADGSSPQLGALFAGLPVAAWSGTLDNRYRSPAPPANRVGAGVVRAKTGSLSGVNAISGVVTTAEGRLLAFAVLADRVPVAKADADRRLDRIVSALAACGC